MATFLTRNILNATKIRLCVLFVLSMVIFYITYALTALKSLDLVSFKTHTIINIFGKMLRYPYIFMYVCM